MRCFAHRGFAGVNPENTLPAVRRAAASGADAIEVDVRRCGSGDLVAIHDATVDRVTDATGAVADLSLSALRDLDVLGSGAGVPALSDVLAAVPADVTLNAELKQAGLAADALALADAHDVDVLVSAFDPALLREAAVAGDPSLALLFSPASTVSEPVVAIDVADDCGCDAVHPREDCCDDGFVERAHRDGLAVNAWTVESPAVAVRLRDAGVDGIIADSPDCCLGSSTAGR